MECLRRPAGRGYLGQGLLVLWVGPLFGLGLAWLSGLKRRQNLVLVMAVALDGRDIWCLAEFGYLFQEGAFL